MPGDLNLNVLDYERKFDVYGHGAKMAPGPKCFLCQVKLDFHIPGPIQ